MSDERIDPLLAASDREGQRARFDLGTADWLTVKEFASRVGMKEHSVREAIRRGTLAYRIERLTTGPKGAIRIVIERGGTPDKARVGVEPATRRYEQHGESSSATYVSWAGMKDRCENPRSSSWEDYGGRGIVVCERWSASYEAFVEDMGHRPVGKSIDRINVDGNYEPTNCRWATAKEQQQNRRDRKTA
jgi:hypothetical protein